jgi:ABC-type nickel/cobalt efflux system permease component RcnA
MPDLASLIQSGSQNLWLFIPSAILLGALHGLEPGHSKTMMAAFIIAVRGTVGQAILLGLAATLSHTLIVWIIALLGLHFGQGFSSEASEPYLQLASGLIILAIAFWMIFRTTQERHAAHGHGAHGHHGLHGSHGHHGSHGSHGSHGHAHDHHHEHPHAPTVQASALASDALLLPEDAYSDAHARMHAEDIQRRFAGRTATTGQIVMFGLTGGLIPCPASVTVLLICLQLKQITMGALLVLCFSIGLALTMVSVGAAAALGVRHASSRFSRLSQWADNAPYFSSALIILVGLYTLWSGVSGLSHGVV